MVGEASDAVWLNARRARRLAMRATWFARPLPDAVVLGAMKAGSTSAYEYMLQHPLLRGAVRKEVHFLDMHFNRGPRWYRGQFDWRRPGAAWVAVEATPMYLSWPFAAERFASLATDAKFVVLLRDPVDRAVSQWKHRTRDGREHRSLDQVIEEERSLTETDVADISSRGIGPYQRLVLTHGLYADHLRRWFDAFERSRFLIVDSEAFFENPKGVVDDILGFVGLKPYPLLDVRPRNVGDDRTTDAEVLDKLAGYYQPHNRRLFDLLDRSFPWRRATAGAETPPPSPGAMSPLSGSAPTGDL